MRVLLAILEAGGGHRAAARAVAAALAERAPDLDVMIEDVGRGAPLPLVSDASAAYRLLLDSPLRPAFEVAWRAFDRTSPARGLVAALYPCLRGHIARLLARFRPDLVVGMHAGVAQSFARYRRETGARWRLATVVTDIVSVHALWSAPAADLTLVPTAEARRAVLCHGTPAARVVETGFPIHPAFVRLARGLPAGPPPLPDCPRVLLMGGGAGVGIPALLDGLARVVRPIEIEVVTGNNPALRRRLGEVEHRHHFRVHGFVTEMAPLMAGCDVVVTKAGPGSLMEAWALRKPTLVGEAVGPQERGNLEWGAARGLAERAGGPDRVAANLTALLERWDAVHARMQPVPLDGAYRIADALLGLIEGAVPVQT